MIRISQCATRKLWHFKNVTQPSKLIIRRTKYPSKFLIYPLSIQRLIIIFREKGEIPLGQNAKMTGSQMTEYMKQFPQSQRTGQTNPTSYYYKYKTAKR